MFDKDSFNHELFRKVFYFEWALLIICGIAQLLVLHLAPPEATAPDLRVSLIFLGIVGALSVLAPIKGSYWDRFCFLLLELMLITGATLAGLSRFLFPIFVVVVAKACLMLDRWGMLTVTFFAVLSSLFWGAFKMHLQNPHILERGFSPAAVATLLSGSFIAVYVAIVLFVLVALLTETQKAERHSRLEAERLGKEVEQLATALERGRIAREIHDSLGHTLISLNIQLDIARKLQDREPERATEALSVAKELASQSLTDVRMALQSIRNDADFNFADAVNVLVNDLKHTGDTMDVQLDLQVDGSLPTSVGYQVFRVIQECLTNVLKHANASLVTIQVAQSAEGLQLLVCDNGKGWETPQLSKGFGIRGMQERVQSMHGTVAINAGPNKGTSIDIKIPLS
ncbi:MAG TPA: sensor histidine kinase [Candidatus Obscuribacterales bacterium]